MAGVVSQLVCVTAEQRHRKQPVEVVVIVKHGYTVPHPPDLAVRKDDALFGKKKLLHAHLQMYTLVHDPTRSTFIL